MLPSPASTSLRLLFTSGLALAVTLSPAFATGTVTINFADDQGTMNRVASGFLHAFSSDMTKPPPTQDPTFVHPLKVRMYRTRVGDVQDYWDRTSDDPVVPIITGTLSGSWGYPSASGDTTGRPWGDGGTDDYTAWENFVTSQVSALNANIPAANLIFDVWNEPDGNGFWWNWSGASWTRFYQTFKRAYEKVKAVNPNLKVAGPGFSSVAAGADQTALDNFKDFCVANACVPDYWSWHFGGDNIPSEVAHVQTWSASVQRPVAILEYLGPEQSKRPGRTAYEIGLIESAGVYRASKAIWSDEDQFQGSINGCLIEDAGGNWSKRGIWHVYAHYANFAGKHVSSTSTTEVNALGAIDNTSSTAWALLGHHDYGSPATNEGNVTLVLKNIKAASGTTVHVTVTKIPYNSYGTVALPAPIVDANFTVTNSAVTVSPVINWTNSDDAYKVTVTNVKSLSVPVPWTTGDIGAPGVAGSASYTSGEFHLNGSGVNIGDNADHFRYVFQTGTGDCEIKAQLLSIENTDTLAKAGVMIRETNAADSKYVAMVLTPGGQGRFQRRNTTGGASSSTDIDTVGVAPKYLRVQRVGNTFTGYYSNNGTTWTTAGSTTITMTSSVQIGLATTSHDDTQLCTAKLDNVTATP
jgi:hypothetical protein